MDRIKGNEIATEDLGNHLSTFSDASKYCNNSSRRNAEIKRRTKRKSEGSILICRLEYDLFDLVL